jgi:DNA repair exonuclease SbcCD ATPase subunit
MTEPTTQTPAEGEQQPEAADPTPAPATATPTAGQDVSVDWEARYKGVMTVLNQKQAELDQAKADAGTAAATVEQLQRDTEALRAEYDTKIAALGEQLSTLTGERDGALKTQEELTAYKTKMEALKGYPDLLPLADTIPDIPDAEVMAQHLELLQKGVAEITTKKAETLTAGMTPGATTPAQQPKYAYSTLDDWQAAMNKAAGSDQSAEVAAAFKKWEGQQP